MSSAPRSLASLLSAILFLAVLGGVSSAQAASPAKPDPSATGVQDEVMMQNLTCDDIVIFLMKGPSTPMIVPATEIMNQPQHSKETSLTLFGPTLTRLILTASGLPPANHPIGSVAPCQVIVPDAAPPQPAPACDGGGDRGGPGPPRLGMNDAMQVPTGGGGGELKLLDMFDHAAKYKNCRR
ncbi:MAG: hypothetical protein JWM33_821 [Caulobacteraceae bacterium]|nr:hypothetical protein [Caulobacteraceae bacterium]